MVLPGHRWGLELEVQVLVDVSAAQWTGAALRWGLQHNADAHA